MNPLFATTLETLLNQAIRLNPSNTLELLADKIIRIELTDLALNFTLFPDQQNIIVLSNYGGEVDVHISGAPFSLLHALLSPNATLVNNPDINIEGNMDVACQLRDFLRNQDIDWETQLAKKLGDVPAHRLKTWSYQCKTQADKQTNIFQNFIREYLQTKANHLPTRVEVELFFGAVTTLHDDLERLEKRVQRLL